MESKKNYRFKILLPLLFSLVMVLGMVLGFRMKETLRYKRDIQSLIQRDDRLEEIIDLVKDQYVDTINTNVLYEDAVNGIISHLDPHTVYITADELQGVNEDLEGSFSGVGIEFNIFNDTIQVTSVIEKGPAEKAGVTLGDQFLKVGDSLVAGNNITNDRIIKLLRGKANTDVVLTMKDGITGKGKLITVTRGAIPLYSIDAATMLDSITGYVKINRFSATTDEEFTAALSSLKKQHMQQLILDLRQNPGGYLDAATKIADQFLAGKKLVVYTKGRKTAKEKYETGNNGLFEQGRLAVLVDEGSASAAEILSGAIQDWDRGFIIGRRTYGKGLVQQQFDLGDGSALRLTIAKYYTPSGRCIQRSYAKGRDAYKKDFEQRFSNGELTGYDTLEHQDTQRYFTAKHRVVYAGGGIKPDVYVPYDTTRLSAALLSMVFSNELRMAVWNYYTHHTKMLKGYKNAADFDRRFDSTGVIVSNYLQHLDSAKKPKATKLLQKEAFSLYFSNQVNAQLARILFRKEGFYFIDARQDNVVNKARAVLKTGQL